MKRITSIFMRGKQEFCFTCLIYFLTCYLKLIDNGAMQQVTNDLS